MRNKVEIDFALQDHLLQQFVFTHVSADVPANLTRCKKQPHAKAVHADVVADGSQILAALAYQGAYQIFGDATQAEPANHDGCAIENVFYRFVRVGDNLVHRTILTCSWNSAVIRPGTPVLHRKL